MGLPARAVVSDGGPVFQVPDVMDLTCTDAVPSNDSAGCSFNLVEATGKLARSDDKPVDLLTVAQMLQPSAVYAQTRNMARINPEQRAAWTGDLKQAAVEQADEGESQGRHFAVGCWRQLASNKEGTALTVDGPYGCTLIVENRTLGSTSVDFYAAAPGTSGAAEGLPMNRGRVDGIVRLVLGVEASFLPVAR